MPDIKPQGGVTVRLSGREGLQNPVLALTGTDLVRRVQQVVGGNAMVERGQTDWSLYDPRGRAGAAYRRGDGSRAVIVLARLGATHDEIARVWRDIEGGTWGTHTREGSPDAATVIAPDGTVIETTWRPFIGTMRSPDTLNVSSQDQLAGMVRAAEAEAERQRKLAEDRFREFARDAADAWRRATGEDTTTVDAGGGGIIIVGPNGPIGGVEGDGTVVDAGGKEVGKVDAGSGAGGNGSGSAGDGQGCGCRVGPAGGGAGMSKTMGVGEAIAAFQQNANQGGPVGGGDKRHYVQFDMSQLGPYLGGSISADPMTIPAGSIVTGQSWESTFSDEDIHRLYMTVLCQGWALASGNGVSDLSANASDFELSLELNGNDVPAFKKVSLDLVLPDLNGVTQRLQLDQPMGVMLAKFRLVYRGPGITMGAPAYVRPAVLSSPGGCLYPETGPGIRIRQLARGGSCG